MFRQLKAFITGSHAYGTPTDESDLDLVVYTDHWTLRKIQRILMIAEEANTGYGTPPQISLNVKEGRLNLILVSDRKEYWLWRRVTRHLKRYSLVTREVAVWHFKKARGLL